MSRVDSIQVPSVAGPACRSSRRPFPRSLPRFLLPAEFARALPRVLTRTLPLPLLLIDGCRRRRMGGLLGLADLFLTLWANSFTPFRELNPIAASLLRDGIVPLVAYKVAVTAIGSFIFWHLRDHRRAEVALWGLAIVYVLLAFRWSDYTH